MGVLRASKPIAALACICHSLRDKSVRIICGFFLKCSRWGCCIVLCCSVLTLRFRFQSPCSRWPCQNNGTCVPQYEKNSFVCLCTREFSGKTCQTSKKINVFTLIALSTKNQQNGKSGGTENSLLVLFTSYNTGKN